jgi:hypothetical protein
LIVKYIRGLCSASTTNLSAALDLHSASCFTSNRTGSAFQPVANKHKGLIKSKMQQRLANFSLSDAISIAKLDIDTDFQPAGLGLRSANSSNLSADLGLCSANSSNLSAGLGLRAASWNSNKTFKLVVASVKNKYSKGSSFTHLPTPNTIQFHHSSLLLSQLLREHLKSFFGHLAS